MSILRLHHVQVTVPRGAEEEARGFYCRVLGLPEIPKPEALLGRGGFWLALGDTQIHVGAEDGVDRRATKSHLAYEVADVEAWRSRLADSGIEIIEAAPLPGLLRFEARDPFGNRIEFVQRTEEEQEGL